MWARYKSNKIMINKDGNKHRECQQKSFNVNEEFQGALRTKSFADFFSQVQSLVNEPYSPSHCHHKFSEFLLQPGQETITSILESAILARKSYLKHLILNYFDISAEASKICTTLLKGINQIQSNYKFIQHVLDILDDHSTSNEFGPIISELHSINILNKPFSNINKQDLEAFHDKYSLVLQHLKSTRKKVARKMKLINFFNKASGVCVTAICGLVAIAAMVLAAHTLTALVMGPALLSVPLKPLKKKLMNFKFLKSGVLRKVGSQLDLAAKETYILNRDFDTMSRLVTRIHDEIEHKEARIKLCLEKREDRFSLQVLKELKKSDVGFRRQVEELEEHVYLCLVTINRARNLVIKELSATYVDVFVK